MLNKGLFTSNTDEWSTPKLFFDEVNKEFNFELDACANENNAKCTKFYTKDQDGLKQDWGGVTSVWVNPPYGRQIGKWIEKAYRTNKESHNTIVMLLPARTDTKVFHEYIYGKAEIRFIRGRLHFNESKCAAPFPSMLVIYKG